MQFKDDTIGDIIESEKQMTLHAAERFGNYFVNASESDHLLQQFIKSIAPDRFVFAIFLQDIRKHCLLALFSAVRLHHIQATMNLRQVLESGSCAAYAIANPSIEGFVDFKENGDVDPSKELAKRRYEWLEANFKDGSRAIKNMKNTINGATAHANIVYAQKDFSVDSAQGKFVAPFFDIEDDYLVKGDLWQIGNVAIGIMDLFYGVNRSLGVVKFMDDFISRLRTLRGKNQQLRTEIMNTERCKNAQLLKSRQRA